MLRLFHWALEAVFVISAIILLKLWVFPFFIHLWYQEVLPIPEWTALIFAVVTSILYIGLGSTAKYIYGLPWKGSIIGFFLIHAILFLPLPYIRETFFAWQGLLLDGFSLFLPKQTVSSLFVSLLYTALFICGRGVVVREEGQKTKKEKMLIGQKK